MFNCEKCGKEILDGKDGYYRGCVHYQVTQLMMNENHGNNKWIEVDGAIRKADFVLEEIEKRYRAVMKKETQEHVAIFKAIIMYPKKGNCGYEKPTFREVFIEAGYYV